MKMTTFDNKRPDINNQSSLVYTEIAQMYKSLYEFCFLLLCLEPTEGDGSRPVLWLTAITTQSNDKEAMVDFDLIFDLVSYAVCFFWIETIE